MCKCGRERDDTGLKKCLLIDEKIDAGKITLVIFIYLKMSNNLVNYLHLFRQHLNKIIFENNGNFVKFVNFAMIHSTFHL